MVMKTNITYSGLPHDGMPRTMVTAEFLKELYSDVVRYYGAPERIIWKTERGEEFEYGKMADTHLSNTIKFFTRRRDSSLDYINELKEQIKLFPNNHHIDDMVVTLETSIQAYNRQQIVVYMMSKEKQRRDRLSKKCLDTEGKTARLIARIQKMQSNDTNNAER